MLLLAMAAAFILSLDEFLDGGPNRLSRGDGLILCLLFGIFLYYIVMELRSMRHDAFVDEAQAIGWTLRFRAISIPVSLALIGLTGLGVGGFLLVESAVGIAERSGMTQVMIGLTLVAIGTTFPELATSLLASRLGEADLAVGNIVGSNIFNILLVLGVATAVSPIEVPVRGPSSLAIGAGLNFLLVILIHTGKMRISRGQGLLLRLRGATGRTIRGTVDVKHRITVRSPALSARRTGKNHEVIGLHFKRMGGYNGATGDKVDHTLA